MHFSFPALLLPSLAKNCGYSSPAEAPTLVRVSGDPPSQAARSHATAGCHLSSGHFGPCNHYISVAMETNSAGLVCALCVM